MKRLAYIIHLLLLGFVSCRDFHVGLVGDTVLVDVDGKHLLQSQLSTVVPKEYRGEDSVAFVEVYIEKWIEKQVKLREAERMFFAAEADIEAMVEEYRQQLLIRRLDEQCVSSSADTTYTDHQISEYYQNHATNFRLSRDIAKGEVLRIPEGSDQAKKLKELMSSSSESKREDMLSICEKNGFEFADLTQSWVEATEILDLLPLVRSEDSEKILSKEGINHMKDEQYDYYYQIIDHKAMGSISPLEWVRSTIRTILITERQQALIRENDQNLYSRAVLEGVVKRQKQQEKE